MDPKGGECEPSIVFPSTVYFILYTVHYLSNPADQISKRKEIESAYIQDVMTQQLGLILLWAYELTSCLFRTVYFQ